LIEEKEIKIRLFKLIKNIHLNPSLLSQITQKQRQHSDKSVYENIDKKINEIFNEKH
jgi:hypothetical protein